MPRELFLYETPDRFVVGTLGEPGSRAFYLQAREAGRVTSVAVEKAQVTVLAERVDELLDEVVRRSGGSAPVPAVAPTDTTDEAPLDEPVLSRFRVGAMALAWDADDEVVVVEAQAETPEADDDEEAATLLDDEAEDGPDLMRVFLTGTMARAFVKRALSIVASGRPSCPFCGLPIDPAGHLCPRANGHRPAAPEAAE